MLFPTVEFGIFFVIVFLTSWALRGSLTGRKIFLLAASYVFYGWWDLRFAVLLAECSMINYMFGLGITVVSQDRWKKVIVAAGVATNLGILGFFKYWGFFASSLNNALASIGLDPPLPFLDVILPVGISFFTFQGISYVIDVYREEIDASTSILDVLLYISFFPQLVAGPIVRASTFIPQLLNKPNPGAIPAARSFLLIIVGLFKKVIVANYLASDLVEPVFSDPTAHTTLDGILALYGYAIQIYCDFSAYSDIAIGSAALLGFHFPKNFDQPYRADSLQDFWRRWHISLSTWLKDYLYRPLGGSREGEWHTRRNVFIVMVVAGIWHGAAWTFVMFGVMHGTWLVLERMVHQRLPKSFRISNRFRFASGVLTFHFVCFSLIFFAADSLQTSLDYLGTLSEATFVSTQATAFSIGLIVIGLVANWIRADLIDRTGDAFADTPPPIQAAFIAIMLLLLVAMGPPGIAPFIYYRF